MNIEIKDTCTIITISNNKDDKWERTFNIGFNNFVEAVQEVFRVPRRLAIPMITDKDHKNGKQIYDAMKEQIGWFVAELQRTAGWYINNKNVKFSNIILSGEGKDIIGLEKSIKEGIGIAY